MLSKLRTRKKERRVLKEKEIAREYVSKSLQAERKLLIEFFLNTRRQDLDNILRSFENIKYEKPWPKGTTLDKAFELAVHEASEIVKGHLGK